MDKKVKAGQIPTQAHHLYVQLYCERKGEKNRNIIQEAKKSWASLSLTKKKLFYKTTADGKLLKFAHDLCRTKTYLKEKEPKDGKKQCEPQRQEQNETVTSINESYLTDNDSVTRKENELINETKNDTKLENDNETQLLNTGSPEAQNVGTSTHELSSSSCGNRTMVEDTDKTQELNIGSPLHKPTSPNQVNEIDDALETQSNTSSVQRAVPLTEPIPPTIRLGRDLYEAIRRPGTVAWKELSRKDKTHYGTAARNIKIEYIKNYTTFLENLTQQQLIDHYIKTLC